jgi:hypothetical protein
MLEKKMVGVKELLMDMKMAGKMAVLMAYK